MAEEWATTGKVTPSGRVVRKYDSKNKKVEHDTHIPQRVEGAVEKPAWVKNNAHSDEIWTHVSEILRIRGQLSRESQHSLEGLAQTYADWNRLRDFLDKNGSTYPSMTSVGEHLVIKGGCDPEDLADRPGCFLIKRRPEAAEFLDADRRFRSWLIEFGLTDYSRSRVRVNPPKEAEKKEASDDYGI
jgi:P27 family predicted phage terminase small subunit